MERFLERVSLSSYKEHLILKGGVLITSLSSISLRSTMDIDASIKGCDLSEEYIKTMINELSS